MDHLQKVATACCCVLVVGVVSERCMVAQTYKVVAEYKLPGATAHGIAADTAARRLYVAGDDGLTVLDLDTGAVVGNVVTKHAQDVLLIPAKQDDPENPTLKSSILGFVAGEGEVTPFTPADLKTRPAQHLSAGGSSSLCFDEFTHTVEAVSAGGSLATLDADTGKLLRDDKLATGAGQIACGTLNHVYVADTERNLVHVLNHATGRIDGDLPMQSGKRPTGLTLDTRGRRLFVSCENKVIEVIDTDAGFTFLELPGGSGPAHALFVWTPQGKGRWKAAAFVAQQDGTLTGVRMNAFINYSIGGQYMLSSGLDGIAFDAKTNRLFLSASRSGAATVDVAGY